MSRAITWMMPAAGMARRSLSRTASRRFAGRSRSKRLRWVSCKTAIFGDAPAVGSDVEVWILDSADVVTVATLVASTPIDIASYDSFSASAALSLYPLAKA